MTIRERLGKMAIVIVGGLVASTGVALWPHGQGSAQQDRQDRAAIERLHALDVETTLTDKADELAKLWDRDAVRLSAGRPAEIGKAVIYADDKRWEASKDRERTLSYVPEVKDLQIAGDWAFEWGYATGSIRDAAGKTVQIRGKQLRILRRQTDGEWKFARVMGIIDSHQ